MADYLIEYTFYITFFFVPLIWLPMTSELFEFNKMIVVYLGTSIILASWLYKTVSERMFSFRRTPLDLPILLFLIANILSTIFSTDPQTSVFGYYSRFNGGLLSTISYLILFYALVTFFDKEKLITLLKVFLVSTGLSAIYGVLQHPNPFFRNPDGSFRGIDAGYWDQNSEGRVFSTLGHPNWLAALMVMVIPPAIFFLHYSQKLWEKSFYALLLILFFLAFTFTYSRGGTVGFVGMALVFLGGMIYLQVRNTQQLKNNLKSYFSDKKTSILFSAVLIACAYIVLAFGNAFISRGIDLAAIKAEGETQLASASPETGKIRLIVWKGAFEVFRTFPIVGSGVETFGYSYYEFKLPEHNLTSEWDFLYNKAHNEFLNYLATTGAVGFASYIALISSFYILVLMYLNGKYPIWNKFFAISLLAGMTGYHGQNIFGFSVVPIALLFYLIPAFFLIATGTYRDVKISLNFFKGPIRLLSRATTILLGIGLIALVSSMWVADYFYSLGQSMTGTWDSYNALKIASTLRPDEPLYKATLGSYTTDLATISTGETREQKIREAFYYLNEANAIAPNNINIWRLKVSALYTLAVEIPGYTKQLVSSAETMGELAPNDAEIQQDIGAIYYFSKDFKKSKLQFERVVELKFNYLEAWKMLLKSEKRLKDEASFEKDFARFSKIFPDLAKDSSFLGDLD